MTDGLSTLYQDLLSGSYDCVDRIVLNAYFRMGHSPGGFRVWWRALTGSAETLENAYLMRLAGRFSRRVRGYAKAHNIAVIASHGLSTGTGPVDSPPLALPWSVVMQRQSLVNSSIALITAVGQLLTREFKPPPGVTSSGKPEPASS